MSCFSEASVVPLAIVKSVAYGTAGRSVLCSDFVAGNAAEKGSQEKQ